MSAARIIALAALLSVVASAPVPDQPTTSIATAAAPGQSSGSGVTATATEQPAARGGTTVTARVKARERQPVGKPRAPISVEHVLSAEPVFGQPLEIRLTARPAPGVGELTLELRAPPELLVGAVVPSGSDPNGERRWTVTVTPIASSAAHLSVFVTGIVDGEPQTRSLAIPIRVAGAKPVPGNAAVKADESGEAVVALPAQENP